MISLQSSNMDVNDDEPSLAISGITQVNAHVIEITFLQFNSLVVVNGAFDNNCDVGDDASLHLECKIIDPDPTDSFIRSSLSFCC